MTSAESPFLQQELLSASTDFACTEGAQDQARTLATSRNGSNTSTSECDDHLPPPYTSVLFATRSGVSSTCARTSWDSGGPSQLPSSSLFSAHLSSLRGQIIKELAARCLAQDQQDHEILSMLVPHIEALLDSIAAINPPASLVEATLVPEEAVDKSWRLSDTEGMNAGHFTKLVRVGRHVKMEDDRRKHPPAFLDTSDTLEEANEFDGWGRWNEGSEANRNDSEAVLWWSDEEVARRLASHLQPKSETTIVDRQAVRAEAEASGEAMKANRWNLFKKKPSSARVSGPNTLSQEEKTRSSAPSGGVGIVVNAEEVTFRRQNEMGLWESETGWGLVVRVSIRT